MFLPFFLGIVAAVCWGAAPIFGKLGLRNISLVDGFSARLAVILVFLVMWSVGTGGLGRLRGITGNEWLFIGVEAFLTALAGDLAYYAALKWGSAGLTAIALAASPVITVLASSIFLHEPLSNIQLVGVVLVMVGIFLVLTGTTNLT